MKLKKFFHWLHSKESWRVIYPDNKRSRRMILRQAKDYSQIFGGRVVFDP